MIGAQLRTMSRRFEHPLAFVLALAATSLLFLSGLGIPLAGVLLLPLVPQPALAYGMRYGKLPAVLLTAAASGLLLLVGGVEAGLGFMLLALMVVMLFLSFGRGWSIEAVVSGTAGGMLAVTIGCLLGFTGSFGALAQATRSSLQQSLDLSLMIYQKAGLSAETVELARQRAPEVIDMIVHILPAVAFVSFVAMILINLVLLSYRFPQYRPGFYSIKDPKEWQTPEPMIWCFILAGFGLFLPDGVVPAGWALQTVALNVLLVVALFYFFQGLAIVAYFFHHKRVPLFLRGVGYGLIALEQLATLSIVGLGLFDLWGDFRRLKKRDLNPTEAA